MIWITGRGITRSVMADASDPDHWPPDADAGGVHISEENIRGLERLRRKSWRGVKGAEMESVISLSFQ